MYYPVANEAKEYTVPQTVTTIAASAFSPTLNLTKVVIPDSVTTIEENARESNMGITNKNKLGYDGNAMLFENPLKYLIDLLFGGK